MSINNNTKQNKTTESDAFDITRPVTYMRQIETMLKTGRIVSYSSEFGEAIRPIAPLWIVKSLWAISFGYVGVDLWYHWYVGHGVKKDRQLMIVGDRAIWHLSASIFVPALTIHTVVRTSKNAFFGTKNGKYAGLGSTLIGLSIIPLIVHPIDNGTDWIMNRTLRKYGNYYVNPREKKE